MKLQCNVKNAQAYTWYKNGAQLSGSLPVRYTIKTNRFLQITDAEKSDSGLFFCVTSNNVGSANCSIELLVEGMDYVSPRLNKSRAVFYGLGSFSINLLAYYHECCSLIGYATHC